MPDIHIDNDEFAALAASILNDGNVLRFKACGESMRPFIQNGDLVEVHAIFRNKVIPGDVIFCRLGNGRLVVHRVKKVTQDSILVQGDGLSYADGYISQDNILGRVDKIYHKGKPIRLDQTWMKLLVSLWLWVTPIRQIVYQIVNHMR